MMITKTLYGKLIENEILDLTTGELVKCFPYKILRDRCQDQIGFYNLRLDDYNCWILFQFIPIDNNSEHDKVS